MNPRSFLSPLALSLPALLAITLYLPALGLGYVTVDFSMIVDRPEYHGDLSTVFRSVLAPFAFGTVYYRPLPLLMLGVEQQVFQGMPFPSHLVSLTLLALNASLLAILGRVAARQLGVEERRSVLVGMTAGGLYALHPALIESTAWISARFDLLVTFFCLLLLIADRCIATPLKRATAAGLSFLAAALSKEMAVGLALALPLWHAIFMSPSPSLRERLRAYARDGAVAVYAGITVAGIAYLLIRWKLAGQVLAAASAPELDGAHHLALVLKSLGQYSLLALLPFLTNGPAHAYQLPIRWSDPDVVRGIGALVAFLVAMPLALRRPRSWRFALPCCFVVVLLPVLNVVPLQTIRDNYVQDRFLTLPIAFLALWAALGIHAGFSAGRRSLRAGLVTLLLGWSCFSMLNVRTMLPLWQDDLSFWSWAYARQPFSASAGIGLQQTLLDRKRFAEAKQLSEEIRNRQGGALRANQQVGYAFALGQLGDPEEGIRYMEGALAALRPSDVGKVDMFFTANAQMGVLQMLAGDLPQARHYLQVALAQYDSNQVRYLLALTLLAAGDPSAGAAMDQVLSLMSPQQVAGLRSNLQEEVAQLRRAARARGF